MTNDALETLRLYGVSDREAGHSVIKWEPRWFIGSNKTGLLTFILGNEIELTEEAKAQLDSWPVAFLEWLAAEEPVDRMAAE